MNMNSMNRTDDIMAVPLYYAVYVIVGLVIGWFFWPYLLVLVSVLGVVILTYLFYKKQADIQSLVNFIAYGGTLNLSMWLIYWLAR